MVTELVIVVFAAILFAYWFRYNCVAILRSAGPRDLASRVAAANHLRFPEVQERLRDQPPAEQLDVLDQELKRDYRILTCLLRYTAGFRAGSYTVEQRILIMDFVLLRWWYALTRRHAQPLARRCLEEQSRILSYFASVMAKRSAAVSRA